MSLHETLQRIATALERIADTLERLEQNRMPLKEPELTPHFAKTHQAEESSGENSVVHLSDPIESFLESRGITVKVRPEAAEGDSVLDNLAYFMGKRYAHLHQFLKHLKRRLNSNGSFQLNLKDWSQESIASTTQLCTRLHEMAFLEEYGYHKSPKFWLYGRVSLEPMVIRFLSGEWLERYIRVEVLQTLEKLSLESLPCSCLRNPQITLPNGDDFELDLLFQIGEHVFWFEAKTGEYQRYVTRYSRMAKLLSLDMEHAYMVLSNITREGALALCSLFQMRVVKLEDFADTFEQALATLFQQE